MKKEILSDVWKLEDADQDYASDDLSLIVEEAMKFTGTASRNYLKTLWQGESWQRIKAKLQTEGSVWYVWWMDGVNTHLNNLMIAEKEAGIVWKK